MKRAAETTNASTKRIKMDSKESCPFDNLPPEVQAYLFSYLDTEALASTSMTSSKWYARLYQWRDRIYIKDDMSILLRKLNDSSLRFLDISSCDAEAALMTQLRRFTALRYLRLHNRLEKQLPATLTNLTQLIFTDHISNELLASLSKLTKLLSLELFRCQRGDIQECSRLTQLTQLILKTEFHAKYLALLTHLSSLSIRPRLEHVQYLRSLTQLQDLRLTGDDLDEEFPASSWLSTLRLMSRLESLRFEKGVIVEDDDEYSFLSDLQHLTRLHVAGIKLQSWPPNLLHLQVFRLHEWKPSLQQLSKLTYLCSIDANKQHYENLGHLPHLKRLRTCLPRNYEDLQILTSLVNLNYLSIEIYQPHKDMYDAVQALLTHLTNLVAVNIGNYSPKFASENFCPPGMEYLSFALEEFQWF